MSLFWRRLFFKITSKGLLTQIFVYPSAAQETLANAYDNGYLKERTMNNTFFFSGEKLLKFTLVFFDFLKFLSDHE